MLIERFFETAVERERIRRLRLSGAALPWTDDPVFQGFRFCNVFRENDRTTAWLRQVTKKLNNATPQHIVTATVAFRWFNWIPTGEVIREVLLTKGWNEKAIRRAVKGRGQLWSGAYIIMPTPGRVVPKLDGVCQCMAALDAARIAVTASTTRSLEETHRELMTMPGMGPFLAYEVVSDLRHTKVLRLATDVNTWANPGPGCLRGLQWVYGEKHTRSRQGLQRSLNHMQELLQLSRTSGLWPEDWPQWEMREVEHWLCEFDKYNRGLAGQRLKRRFP